jgi:adenylate cyclase
MIRLPPSLLGGSPWRLRLVAMLCAAVCVLAFTALAPGLLPALEERATDMFWRVGASASGDVEERRFVIVDIDEASIAQEGAWPWPRERVAELSKQLGALGASLQIYDVVFPERRPGDEVLIAQFARQPVVLAQIFSLDPAVPVAVGKPQAPLAAGAPACGPQVPLAAGYIANSPALSAIPGLAVGHITPRIAADGAVRHLPAIVCYQGRAHPSLGLAAIVRGAEAEAGWSLVRGGGWLDSPWRLTHPALPGMSVPLDDNGDARVSYRLPRRALVSVSAADVLSGRAPADLFRGSWALVGATAFGIGDAVPTPHGGSVAGVEVNAQFMSALLDDRVPYTPRAADALLLGLGLAGGALLLLILAMRRVAVLTLPLAGLTLALVLLALHGSLQLGSNVWLGWAAPALFCVLAGVLLAGVEHARARFERGRIYGNLASYLPEPVAKAIAFHEPTDAIEAQRREITVLFADIRNFSAYCEGRPPEEAAGLLHAFFTAANRIVEAHGGLVEEFIGDAVMAVWNAPSDCPDHAARALGAARALQTEISNLFGHTPPGLEPLALGIGIETGSALVGSFGPANRRTHTAMGETVTIAARLQAMTADLAQPILLGEGTAARLPANAVLSLGSFLLEGMRASRIIYAPPLAQTSDTPQDVARVVRLASR